MNSCVPKSLEDKIIIGVDTHKHSHVAVALDTLGRRLGQIMMPATTEGYGRLVQWGQTLGTPLAFGVEGTGSYGAGLTRHLVQLGYTVREVNRPDRRLRRQQGKNDVIDAENAARAVLSAQATAVPKRGEQFVEMIRVIKIARDTAVKARTQAMVTLKTLVITAPAELREELETRRGKKALINYCARLCPGEMTSPTASTQHALRTLARRWLELEGEIQAHSEILNRLVSQRLAALVEAFGIGTDTAAEMLIMTGDNPQRIRSEAAFAKLCGVCPIPASSGKTHRHRLNRGGHRQANAALYRVVIVRMRSHPPTRDYVTRRTAEGKTKSEIIRCLKRYLAREIYRRLAVASADHVSTQAA